MTHASTKTRITTLPGGQTVDTGLLPRVALVPCDLILIDDSYQREISDNKVKEIAEAFEEHAAGLILLSQRRDGSLYCYDGQHRLKAVRDELERPMIACAIYDGLSIADEARLFVRCNYQRGVPRTFAVYRARLRARDVAAVDMQAVFDAVGVRPTSSTISNKRHPREVWALGACERIYKLSGGHVGLGRETLQRVLETSIHLWPEDPFNMAQYVLLGIWRFHMLYQARAGNEWIRKLEGTELPTLLESAHGLARINKTGVNIGFGTVILDRYNRGRQHVLPNEFRKAITDTGERPALRIELG